MRVICSACGCHLETVPGVPLDVVACPECGKRIDLRKHAPPEAEPVPVPSGPSASKPVPRRGRRSWVGPTVAIAAMGTAVAAGVLLATRPHGDPVPAVAAAPTTAPAKAWDRAHRGDLLSVKDRADAMALGGDLRGSYDAYNRLLAMAAEHGVSDPVAVQVVAAARSAQDRVFAAMMAQAGTATAALPATTPSSAAQPPTVPEPPATVAPAMPVGPPVVASSRPATAPAPMDPADVARLAADTAPPVARPPPPPQLRAYTLQDGVSDEEIGQAIDRAIAYLRAHGGTSSAVARGRGPGGRAQRRIAGGPGGNNPGGPDGGPDLDGGSSLGTLPARPNPPVGLGPRAMPPGGPFAGRDDLMTLGPNLLATYALLNAGEATNARNLGVREPAVAAALDQIKGYALGSTYTRSLRAAALAVYNRPEDRSALEQDVAWLVAAQRGGGYTYAMPVGNNAEYDNSNSQYGLFGVWSGAQAGISVGRNYWSAVADHWVRCATPAGTWGYHDAEEPAYLSMTLAGVASLLVSHEYLDAAAEGNGTPRPPAHTPALDAGLTWLDQGDNCLAGIRESTMPSYTTYGLERVGLASGYKYFGRHDWYAEIARRLVNSQRGDGSWRGGAGFMLDESVVPVVDTSYYLLFLARGRHPILYNKLRYDGDWNDRPHDVAHLARFATQQLERPLNWQVVNLRRTWFDWMDSPVLYIAGSRPPAFADADYAALRAFAEAGGLIFTHADGGSLAFSSWVRELARRAFPKYDLAPVPKGHPLYSVVYPLKQPPPLQAVSNGSRLLLVHSPTDIAGGWQLNWSDEKAGDFQLGLNVFVYAAGKADLKNRLASTYIPPWPGAPEVTRSVARLRYAGEWDPEPYAWTRFARYFAWETEQGLDVQTVDLDALRPGQVPAAFLTGTRQQEFTPAEAAAARAYVAAGGVLVIDACGGQEPFAKSVRATLLPAAFPDAPLGPLPADHPLFVPSRPFADDLRKMPLRPFAREQLGTTAAVPIEGAHIGKGWVVFSRLDLTTGLLGTPSWGILGYDPAHAQALVKNAVLWASARSPRTTP